MDVILSMDVMLCMDVMNIVCANCIGFVIPTLVVILFFAKKIKA
jgi:hypothetical protein